MSVLAWCFGAIYSFLTSSDSHASGTAGRALNAGDRLASSMNSGETTRVSWFSSAASESAQSQGKVERMNVWDQGQRAWEASEEEQDWDLADSMLEDEEV